MRSPVARAAAVHALHTSRSLSHPPRPPHPERWRDAGDRVPGGRKGRRRGGRGGQRGRRGRRGRGAGKGGGAGAGRRGGAGAGAGRAGQAAGGARGRAVHGAEPAVRSTQTGNSGRRAPVRAPRAAAVHTSPVRAVSSVVRVWTAAAPARPLEVGRGRAHHGPGCNVKRGSLERSIRARCFHASMGVGALGRGNWCSSGSRREGSS
jgi:hypothetical protein